MTDPHQSEEEEGLAALDRAILPRALKLFSAAVLIAVAGEVLAPRLLASSNSAVRYAGALAAGLAVGGVGFAFMGLAFAAAAAASLGLRRLRARGMSAMTIKLAIVLSLAAFIIGLVIFLPFCLGSLPEGTYDCIPLGTRLAHWLSEARSL